MLRAKSADGLAPLSFELESYSLFIHTSYCFLVGMPFNAYGEAVLLAGQCCFILALVYYYSKVPLWRTSCAAALLSLLLGSVLSGKCMVHSFLFLL